MNLKESIYKIDPKDYSSRIPKLIHYVYDITDTWDTSYINMEWFKAKEEAEKSIKEFMDEGGVTLVSFTNDYKRIKIYKDGWLEKEYRKTKEKQIQRKEDSV